MNFIYKDYKAHIMDSPLESCIEFCKKKLTLGTIESCTGGLIGKLITDIQGVSLI